VTAEPLSLADGYIAIAKADSPNWPEYVSDAPELRRVLGLESRSEQPEECAGLCLCRGADNQKAKWIAAYGAELDACKVRMALEREADFRRCFVDAGRAGRFKIAGTDGGTGQPVTCGAELFVISGLGFDFQRNKITRDPAPEIIGACVVLAEPQPIEAVRATRPQLSAVCDAVRDYLKQETQHPNMDRCVEFVRGKVPGASRDKDIRPVYQEQVKIRPRGRPSKNR